MYVTILSVRQLPAKIKEIILYELRKKVKLVVQSEMHSMRKKL